MISPDKANLSEDATISRRSPGYGNSFIQTSKDLNQHKLPENSGIKQLKEISSTSTLQLKVTKTPEEIEAKIAELEADDAVIKPGQEFDRNNKTITDKVMKNQGFKREVKEYSPTLCGKKITGGVNILVKDKIDKVNAQFDVLDEEVKSEITNSLQKVAGLVYRVQTNTKSLDKDLAPFGLKGYRRAKFSDHAVGCAIDVNENMGTKQNHHFSGKDDIALINFVEKIIKIYEPGFDLDKTKGLDHLIGINSFIWKIQRYINELLYGPDTDYFDVFNSSSEKTVKDEIKNSKNDTENCRFILENWDIFKGWVKGTSTKIGKDRKTKKDKMLNLTGIIDLHQTFLVMMLKAGWTWGGDGEGFERENKDYMHFEDRDAMEKMKTKE